MSRSSWFLFSWETCSNRKWTAKFSLNKKVFFCSFTFAKLIDLRVCWQLIALYRAKALDGILVWFLLVSWLINHCGLFKSNFMHINSSPSDNSV